MAKFSLIFILLIVLISCGENKKTALEKKETQSAFQPIKDSIKKYPDSLLLREILIQQYRDSGFYDSAIGYTQSLLKIDSSIARFWFIEATLQIENGDTAAAIDGYEKAANLNPTEKHLTELGNVYAITGNKRALAVASLLSQNPEIKTQRNPHFIRGIYYNAIGNNKAAIPFFDDCLKISYTDMEAYLAKSISLYDMGNYSDALAVLDKAITLQNNFETGYYYKGKTLEKLNRLTEAADAYRQALLYDREYAEAKEALKRIEGK